MKEAVRQVLTKQLNKRYEKKLSLRKISYDAWVRETEQARAALQPDETGSCGGFVLLVQKAGRLSDRALQEMAAYFAAHPQVQILYGDEDLILADGARANPWYKPCWSPDLYETYFYFGSVIAVRRSLYERVLGRDAFAGEASDGEPLNREALAGYGQGVAPDAEGKNGAKHSREQGQDLPEKVHGDFLEFADASEIRGLVHCLLTEAGGFRKGCNAIGHVEYILFHGDSEKIWQGYRNIPGTVRGGEEQSGTMQERTVPNGTDSAAAGKAPAVSIIIPSKDNPQILHTCLKSLKLEQRPNVEVLVVDNGSTPENRAAVETMISESGSGNMRYLYQPMEFNFSRMCNLGAKQAAGSLLLFLNDDMEMGGDNWLEVMAEQAARQYAGAVGLKLYYPDTVRIQHAGIVNLPVGPVHKLQFLEDDRDYYFGRNRGRLNCAAVTGACLMVEKAKFEEAGRFPESLRVAYNDVALGFALAELGYQNVVINDRHGWHHESLSRGNDETKEKLRRLEQERELLYRLHPAFRGEDPYYPAGLNRQGLDSRVTPGYVTAKNTVQANGWTALPYPPESLRWDACLMARVESSGPELIQGYSVVLGDNNACYDKYLVLIPEHAGAMANKESAGGRGGAMANGESAGDQSKAAKSTGASGAVKSMEPHRSGDTIWHMKLEGQYRQDLEENIPDQVNVALGGFCVSRAQEHLPGGIYSIAVLAVNRISGLKLINESGKYLEAE